MCQTKQLRIATPFHFILFQSFILEFSHHLDRIPTIIQLAAEKRQELIDFIYLFAALLFWFYINFTYKMCINIKISYSEYLDNYHAISAKVVLYFPL